MEWINQKLALSWSSWSTHVKNVSLPLRNLHELHDGLLVIYLLECLYKCELKKELHCRLRLHKVKNFDTCLAFMRTNRHVSCVGIQPYDLVDCASVKIMLGFLFLIRHDYEYKYLNELPEMGMSSDEEELDDAQSVHQVQTIKVLLSTFRDQIGHRIQSVLFVYTGKFIGQDGRQWFEYRS